MSILNTKLSTPYAFEFAIAQKIQLHSTTSLHPIFVRMDIDNDGFISKIEFIEACHFLWGMKVTNPQMDIIFSRIVSLEKSKNGMSAPESEKSILRNGISYNHFMMFVHHLLEQNSLSTQPYGACFNEQDVDLRIQLYSSDNDIYSNAPPPSTLATKNRLRKSLLNSITQSSNSVTNLFQQIDTRRNNNVSPQELRDWAKKIGFQVNMEELRLLWGSYWCEKGMDYSSFVKFIDQLNSTAFRDNDCKGPPLYDEVFVLLFKQTNIAVIDNTKIDKDLLSTFKDYIYSKNMTLMQMFLLLDNDTKGELNNSDIIRGLSMAGLNISLERSTKLINHYSGQHGCLNRVEFIRMMASSNI